MECIRKNCVAYGMPGTCRERETKYVNCFEAKFGATETLQDGSRPIPVVGELEKILSYRTEQCAGCEWHPDVCKHCEQSLHQ
jgi:hypothetical protein